MSGPPQLPRLAWPGLVVLLALPPVAGLAAPAAPELPGPAAAPGPAPALPAPAADPAEPGPAAAPAVPAPASDAAEPDQAPAPATTGPRAHAPARPPARPPPGPGEIPSTPPQDPNDAPFMRPPNNQPAPTRLRTSPDLRRGYSSVRRVALTVAPIFASFRLPFLCRDSAGSCRPDYDKPERRHGAGVGAELDVQIIRWLWLRAQGSYSVHPVGATYYIDEEMKTTMVAAAGKISALGFGAGPVVAIDLGRFLPLIEGGIGGLRVATPAGLSKGQMGEACLDGGVCDVGLRCGAGNTCQQSVIPELYFGGAVDVLVRKHISLGAQFRYTALLSAPGKFPVYLIGALRLGVRF